MIVPLRGKVETLRSSFRRSRNPVDDSLVDTYITTGIASVPGWLSIDAILPIRRLAEAQHERGVSGGSVEIGVHKGQMFILLALLGLESDRAVGYDLFARQEENVDGSGLGDKEFASKHLVEAGVESSRFKLVTVNSFDLTLEQILSDVGARVRLFSVDGGHTPEVTTNDLKLAAGSLSDGGIIILDDVFSQMWPGVSEGLRSFMSMKDDFGALVPFGLVGNKTLLCRPDWHETYILILDRLAGDFLTRTDEFYGSRVRILLDP
jgi:hypothetical protein